MKMKMSLLVLVGLLSLVACVPNAPTVTTSANPLNWKEGYGGDSIAVEVRQYYESTCLAARKLKPFMIRQALETDVEVADAICGLLNKGELVIESVDQPVVNGIEKDAVNYPDRRPRRLEVKKSFWKSAETTQAMREKLLLHELAPLIELEDEDLVRSSRLRLALLATRGTTFSEVICNRGYIRAQLSGATPPLARWLSRKLGESRCAHTVDVLVQADEKLVFDDSLRNDLSHAYLIGIVAGATLTSNIVAVTDFESSFVDGLQRLPGAFVDFSVQMCTFSAAAKDCGGIVEYLFGATAEQKMQAIADTASPIDFDRAALSLIAKLRSAYRLGIDTGLVVAAKSGPEVNGKLVLAAIRGQNWAFLRILGDLQREIRPSVRAGLQLTVGFDWVNLLKGVRKNTPPGYLFAPSTPLKNCSPDSFRQQVQWVLDGGTGVPRCDDMVI